MGPDEEMPELPSLRIPLIDQPLETPRSPLRSDSDRQRAQRMQILREGHQRVRQEAAATQIVGPVTTPETRARRPQGQQQVPLLAQMGVAKSVSMGQMAQVQVQPQVQPQAPLSQGPLSQSPLSQAGFRGPVARTSQMASRLVSNFHRATAPAVQNATHWDDSMWVDLARLLTESVQGPVDPAYLPSNVYSEFKFLSHRDLEDRVQTLVEWTRTTAPTAPDPDPDATSAPVLAPSLTTPPWQKR